MEGRLENGRILDGYVVESRIGQGANATVYAVRNIKAKSHHALKVLRNADSRRIARIEQEAVLRLTIFHPNILRITKVLEVDDCPALLMDLVDGPSLERWLVEDQRADLFERLNIFRQVVKGCKFAHEARLVHRDLKPSNILLSRGPKSDWVPRISDFGLAKALEPEVGRYGGLTTVNTGLGSVGYAAPEQVQDAAGVDHRADLYSLGCILYELTCGVGPFYNLSAFDTLQAQREPRYHRPEDLVPGLPPALYDLIRQLLAPRPDLRPADCDEVLVRLDAVLTFLDRASAPAPHVRSAAIEDLAILGVISAVPLAFLGGAAVLATALY